MKSNASDEGNFAFTSLLAVLERHGDNTALVEVRGNDLLTHSHRDLATRAGALARGLLREDSEPGERLGLMAPERRALDHRAFGHRRGGSGGGRNRRPRRCRRDGDEHPHQRLAAFVHGAGALADAADLQRELRESGLS